jgi:S-adenosylmethionine:tRNA ribosyltransferase-isomerase
VRTEDFEYDLPSGFIAQTPAVPRDSCRLMIVDRMSGQIDHRLFSDLPDYIRAGDVLVVNETRVIPARLKGAKEETGGAVEVLLLRRRYDDTWECLVKPGRRLKPSAHVEFGDGRLAGLVVDVLEESGARLIQFTTSQGTVMDAVHELGEMPLPPYVTGPLEDPELYQTVFAADERSAAAPTAGLHFTEELLARVEDAGATVAKVELDVGLDTFRPVAEDDPTQHRMHREHFRVGEEATTLVNEALTEGARVIAVGTTAVRALESAFDNETELLEPVDGETDLFILPGHRFGAVDGLVTNFHLPRSTLLMMVSAFAGRRLVMEAYSLAGEEGYRFLSFGDAMLFL